MERIENILRRIQELYHSKHEKTGIDIDLMLDYTRVMYADLLEWRKRFKDVPETPVVVERKEEEPVAATAVEEQQQTVPGPEKTVQAGTPETVKEEAASQVKEPDAPVVNNNAQEQEAPEENQIDGPQKEEEEAEVVKEVLHNNSSAISFEPPAPRLPHTAEIEDVLTEEDPLTNTPVEGIVLPEIEEMPQQPLIPKAPPAAAGTTPALKKDIRGTIGINDKYLFLNELFSNNKTDYEEALDQLRLFDNADQAYTWLKAHPGTKHSWDENDNTVQAFLGLVNQYFASR